MGLFDAFRKPKPFEIDPALKAQLEKRGMQDEIDELNRIEEDIKRQEQEAFQREISGTRATPPQEERFVFEIGEGLNEAQKKTAESVIARRTQPEPRALAGPAKAIPELVETVGQRLGAGARTVGRGAQAVGGFAADIVRSVPRAVVSVGLEPAAGILSLTQNRAVPAIHTPESPFERFVFGDEPILGLFERTKRTQETSSELLRNLGFDEDVSLGASLALAPFAVGFTTFLDLSPVGGTGAKVGKKTLQELTERFGKEAAEKIAKQTSEKVARKALEEGGEQIVKNLGIDFVEKAPRQLPLFNANQYVSDLVKTREAARKVSKNTTLRQNFFDFYKTVKRSIVDFNAPIEDAIREAGKRRQFELLPKFDITNQIDRVLRAPAIGGEFVKRHGFADVIRTVDNLDNLDQYLIAKQALSVENQGFETGRDLIKDARLVELFKDKYEPFAKSINEYSRRLLDYSAESELISKELAAKLKETYPNYVPLNRVFNELEKSAGTFGGRGTASLSGQNIVKKLQGSKREIESPIASLLAKTNDAFVQGEKNRAAAIIARLGRQLPELGIKELKSGESAPHMISFIEDGVKKRF